MTRLLGVACLLVAFGITSHAEPANRVRVAVRKDVVGKGIRYSYRVTNGGTDPICQFSVGYDAARDSSELHVEPVGYDFDAQTRPASIRSPRGWLPRVLWTEEDSLYMLEWEIDTTVTRRPTIGKDRTLDGFAVVVPREDPALESGHWWVIFESGDRIEDGGSLKP